MRRVLDSAEEVKKRKEIAQRPRFQRRDTEVSIARLRERIRIEFKISRVKARLRKESFVPQTFSFAIKRVKVWPTTVTSVKEHPRNYL